MGKNREAVEVPWWSGQRSGQWWYGAGRGPFTPEKDYRLQTGTYQRWKCKSNVEGTASMSNQECQLYLRQSSNCGISIEDFQLKQKQVFIFFFSETSILIWDTKKWLRQYWKIKIADSKWKLRQCNKDIIHEKKSKQAME